MRRRCPLRIEASPSMTITFDFWLLLLGAVAGIVGVFVARGRNRLIKAAVAGAAAVFLLDLARDLL